MLDRLLVHNRFRPKRLFVVEIFYSDFDRHTLALSEVKLIKNKPVCVHHSLFDDISSLQKQLPEKANVSLLIHGEQCVTQEIELDENTTVEDVFIWGEIKDFYIQHTNTWITFSRKELVNNWLTAFKEKKCAIIDLNLGVLSVQNYFSGIQLNPGSYSIHHYLINWNGEEINQISTEKNSSISNKIESEYPEGSLLSISASIKYLFNIPTPTNHIPIEPIQLAEYGARTKEFNGLLAKIVLPILLVALLGNFFYQGELEKQHQSLQVQLAQKEKAFKEYAKLQESLDEKGAFINEDGQNGHLSYYADQIAFLKPAQVKLSSLHVNPVDYIKKSDIQFTKKQLIVEGLTFNNNQFQTWIDLLKKCDWLSSIDIVQFQQSASKKQASFKLKIYIL